jgi:hypothetical protein
MSAEGVRLDDLTLEWLWHRGGAEDRQLDDRHGLGDVRIAWRINPVFALTDVLPDALADRRVLRHARSSGESIGSYPADMSTLLAWDLLWRPALLRMAMAAVAAALALLAHATVAAAVLLGIGAALIGWGTSWPIIVGIAACIAAVMVDTSVWWLAVLTPFAGLWISVLDRLLVMLGGWRRPGSLLGFIPVRTRLAVAWRRRWGALAAAVGFATGNQPEQATPFLDRCEGRLPPDCAAVLSMCRALVAASRDDLGRALELGATALEQADAAPSPVAGWCAAQFAQLLQVAGELDPARRYRDEAVSKLTGRGCRKHRIETWFRQLDDQVARGDLAPALEVVRVLRRQAVRRRDAELVALTELWLARMMVAVGNHDGAAWTLREVVAGEDGRRMHGSGRETARDLLLRASVLADQTDPADRARARRDAEAAMHHLDWKRRPLAAAGARRILARIEEAEGEHALAVAHALAALAAVQWARYALPSTSWRNRWSSHHQETFALALRLASAHGDTALVAQLLELARGQVLLDTRDPERDLQQLKLLNVLDAALAPPMIGRQPAAATYSSAASRLDPARQPPPVRAGGPLRVPYAESSPIDLELELASLSGRCWYWAGITVGDAYIWAVRSPEGNWWHGRASIADGTAARRAYDDLLVALPLSRPGEDEPTRRTRLQRSPLARTSITLTEQPRAELDLLTRVADAFLPPPLVEGLRCADGGHPTQLVVALSTMLAIVPVAGLPVPGTGDVRVVERAVVSYAPAWQGIAAGRRARGARASAREWPIRLAVLAPDGAPEFLDPASPSALVAPPGTQRTALGPLSKRQLLELMEQLAVDPDWMWFVAGHIVNPPGAPAAGGLRLRGREGRYEFLTTRDLAGVDPHQLTTRVPRRVALAGCESFGLDTEPFTSPGADHTPVGEWLGLAAGMLFAGAHHVLGTLYPIPAGKQARRLDQAIAATLTRHRDPAAGLREAQLAELRRWREGRSGHPMVWQGYAYVGLGAELVGVGPGGPVEGGDDEAA